MNYTADPPVIPLSDYPSFYQLGDGPLASNTRAIEMGFTGTIDYLGYLEKYRRREQIINDPFSEFLIKELFDVSHDELVALPMDRVNGLGHSLFAHIPRGKTLKYYTEKYQANLAGYDDKYHYYEITLTTTPGTSEDQLVDRIIKISKSKAVGALFFEYAIEHPDTNLHAHCFVITTKHIRGRDILRMNKGDRNTVTLVKNITAFRKYISKETTPIIIVNDINLS